MTHQPFSQDEVDYLYSSLEADSEREGYRLFSEMITQTDQREGTDERERERHYAAHYATFYSSDDKIAAVELLREAGYWFRWNYTNSCGQEIGFWTNGDTYPSTHECYDHAMMTIALYTTITPEQIKERSAQNRRAQWSKQLRQTA